jgi:FKBP-type peptidyl-prolyl cis-trans isomerase SlyD
VQIAKEKVATIDYTLTDDKGELLDSSEDDGPLSYLHGHGNIVPGLEKALEGKTVGDSLKITLPPSDGYGEHDKKLIQTMPRDRFPDGEIELGTRFHAESRGESRVLTVTAVNDRGVTVDGNHPLAGRTLRFEVTVREVREATGEEIEHGHVHDGHGHDHDDDDEDEDAHEGHEH